MNTVAVYFNGIYIYFHGIIIVLAALLTIAISLIMCKKVCRGKSSTILNTALLALPLGIIFSRAFYCLSNFTEFSSAAEICNLMDGGHSLYGAMLGVFIAIIIACWSEGLKTIGLYADCIATAAAFGICIGRLGSYFSFDNVGIVMNDMGYCMFPFSIFNKTTSEWLLATFIFEALAEFIMFFCLWATLIDNYDKRAKSKHYHGDTALIFIMMHGALEAVADSMHTDALRFPFNSFVRVQQIIAAFSLAAVIIFFWIRSIRNSGFSAFHLISIVACAALIGLAVYMEFDRISNTNYWFNHGVMLFSLIGTTLIGFGIYKSSLEKTDN